MLPKLKDFRKYIGMGVAVKMPSGRIEKFKIAEVSIRCDREGMKVTSVLLENATWQYFSRTSAWPSGQFPISPGECFRNRGECARYYANEQVQNCSRRIGELTRQITSCQNDLKYAGEKLQEERRKYDSLMKAIEKSKWSLRETCDDKAGN